METLAQKVGTTIAFLSVCVLAVWGIPNIHLIWKFFH
jgi:hypothetical protein